MPTYYVSHYRCVQGPGKLWFVILRDQLLEGEREGERERAEISLTFELFYWLLVYAAGN